MIMMDETGELSKVGEMRYEGDEYQGRGMRDRWGSVEVWVPYWQAVVNERINVGIIREY